MPAGQMVAILGREFLTPDPSAYKSQADLLKAAVDLAGERGFHRKRASVELVVCGNHGCLAGALMDEPETLSNER